MEITGTIEIQLERKQLSLETINSRLNPDGLNSLKRSVIFGHALSGSDPAQRLQAPGFRKRALCDPHGEVEVVENPVCEKFGSAARMAGPGFRPTGR